jgi:hypothetical protein
MLRSSIFVLNVVNGVACGGKSKGGLSYVRKSAFNRNFYAVHRDQILERKKKIREEKKAKLLERFLD